VFTATLLVTLAVAADPFQLLGPPGRLGRVSAGLLLVPRRLRSARRRAGRGRRYAQIMRSRRKTVLIAAQAVS
jgi:hypothetical protein